jgi:hypothetical protein
VRDTVQVVVKTLSVSIAARCLDSLPVGVNPFAHRLERSAKRLAELRYPVKRGGLNALAVEAASDESIALGTSKRLGEHLVRNAPEPIVKVLIAAPSPM